MFGCVGNDSFGVELINYLKANDVQADNVRVQEGTCLKTGEILEVPARKAKVADTTGAGDTIFDSAWKNIMGDYIVESVLTY